MPGLADTTIRLLGQDPLAGRIPTAEQLRVAEILDRAGFSYLEVSGGGCFDSDVLRLHDPLNDVSNLRAAAAAVAKAGAEFEAGLVYSPGRTGETSALLEQARELPSLRAARVLLQRPTGPLQPPPARELGT